MRTKLSYLLIGMFFLSAPVATLAEPTCCGCATADGNWKWMYAEFSKKCVEKRKDNCQYACRNYPGAALISSGASQSFTYDECRQSATADHPNLVSEARNAPRHRIYCDYNTQTGFDGEPLVID